MKKEIYDRAELELVKFSATSVLVDSDPNPKSDDDDELPLVPGDNN